MGRDSREIGQAIIIGLAVLFTALAGSASACASALALNPVRVSLDAGHPVGMLTLRNDGDQGTVVQLQASVWAQVDGKDVYTATTEIVATPPVFTVPPGGSQIVRVGLRHPAAAPRELSYRLFLQEVPPPPKRDFKGLRVAMRFGVPVFATSITARDGLNPTAAPTLQWHLKRAAGGLVVSVSNPGNVHVQLVELTIGKPGATQALGRHATAEYVLAGQTRDLPIDIDAIPPDGTPLRIHAATGTTSMEADVVLESQR